MLRAPGVYIEGGSFLRVHHGRGQGTGHGTGILFPHRRVYIRQLLLLLLRLQLKFRFDWAPPLGYCLANCTRPAGLRQRIARDRLVPYSKFSKYVACFLGRPNSQA